MQFNTNDPAAIFSQLSGVLAGLAFTVLVLYVIGERRQNAQVEGGVATALLSAFISLTMCALNFSFPAETSLTVTTIVIHVPVFGVSILLLFYAVALASLKNRVMRDAVQLARWLVVLIGPLLIMVSLVADVVDMRELRCITDCRDNTPAPIYTAVTTCLALLVWGSWLLAKGYQARRRTTREYGAAGYMAVGMVLTDFFVEFLLGFQGLHYWPSSTVQIVGILVIGAALGVFMWLCGRLLPPGGDVNVQP